jgi:hypothetical protein
MVSMHTPILGQLRIIRLRRADGTGYPALFRIDAKDGAQRLWHKTQGGGADENGVRESAE